MSRKLITNNDIKSKVLTSYKQLIKYAYGKISRMSGTSIAATITALKYVDLNDEFIESEIKSLVTNSIMSESIRHRIIKSMFKAKPLTVIKTINDIIDNNDYRDCLESIVSNLINEVASSNNYGIGFSTKLAEPLLSLLVKVENKVGYKLYIPRKRMLMESEIFIYIHPFRLFTIEELHRHISSWEVEQIIIKLMQQLSLDLITRKDCEDILHAIPGVDREMFDAFNTSDETGVFNYRYGSLVIIDADKFNKGDNNGVFSLKQFKYFNEKQGIALPLRYVRGENWYEKEDIKYIVEVLSDKLVKDKDLSVVTGYNDAMNNGIIRNISSEVGSCIDILISAVLLRALTILYKTDSTGFSTLVSNIRRFYTPDTYEYQLRTLMSLMSYSSMLIDLCGTLVPTEVIDALFGTPNSIKELTDTAQLKHNGLRIFNSSIARTWSPIEYIKLIKAWDISRFFAPFKMEGFNREYNELVLELYSHDSYNSVTRSLKEITTDGIVDDSYISYVFNRRDFGNLYVMANYLSKNQNVEDAAEHFKGNDYLTVFIPSYANYFSDGTRF